MLNKGRQAALAPAEGQCKSDLDFQITHHSTTNLGTGLPIIHLYLIFVDKMGTYLSLACPTLLISVRKQYTRYIKYIVLSQCFCIYSSVSNANQYYPLF